MSIERQRGPQPSEQMVSSIAQGLHLSLDERDHLFRLAGHQGIEPVEQRTGLLDRGSTIESGGLFWIAARCQRVSLAHQQLCTAMTVQRHPRL